MSLENLTNEELIPYAQNGRKNAAVGIIYKRLNKPLIRHIIPYVREEEIAEEIVNEAFIKVIENIDTFNPRYKVSTWIYRIAINLAINQCRRKKKENDEERIRESMYPEPNFEQGNIDLIEKLDRAIASLNYKYRDIIIMNAIDGREYSQISDIMDLPLGTVKSRINRAKILLKKNLSRQDL